MAPHKSSSYNSAPQEPLSPLNLNNDRPFKNVPTPVKFDITGGTDGYSNDIGIYSQPSESSFSSSNSSGALYPSYPAGSNSKRRNGPSISSEKSLLSVSSTSSDGFRRGRGTIALILFMVIMFMSMLAMVVYLMIQLADVKQHLKSEISKLQEKTSEFCMPCGELKLGPFDEDTHQLQFLEKKMATDGVHEICCAKTPNQTQTMFDLLFQRKQMQKCNTEIIENENKLNACNRTAISPHSDVTSAHLLMGAPSQTKRGYHPIRDWMINDNVAYIHGIKYSDGRLKVNSSGLYFVYSQVYFVNVFNDTGRQADSKILHHSVYRFNVNLPNGGTEELMHTARTECWDTRKKYSDYTSYTGAAIRLMTGDELYIKVSDISMIARDPKSTFVGIFKIG